MKGLFSLMSLCLISLTCGLPARSVSDAGDVLTERDMSAWRRQFETTCAFYRWSHCPGKKEVDEKVSIKRFLPLDIPK